ncbi:hypothetical protein [Streptomyces vinaceus]|uniref:hypothetical protein n=1 Tax=Streptomyces vinaceus TaxID=1960 RepID=UPI00380310A6
MADHTPLPGLDPRLLMLTLRTAHTGIGNLVGQDLVGLGLGEPEDLIEKLTDCGWLSLPGTASDLLASKRRTQRAAGHESELHPSVRPALGPGLRGAHLTFGALAERA